MIWSFKPPQPALSFKTEIKNSQDGSVAEYTLHLKKTQEFSLNGIHSGNKESQRVLQVLNSVLKKNLQKINMVEIGRNSKFYNPKNINDNKVEGSTLRVWRGYTTTIQIVNGSAYLMVDFSTRVLRTQNLAVYMANLKKDEIRELVGSTIIALYGNYRTYKIDDFDYKRGPNSTFRNR